MYIMKKVNGLISEWYGRSSRTDRYDSQVDAVCYNALPGVVVGPWSEIKEGEQYTHTLVHEVDVPFGLFETRWGETAPSGPITWHIARFKLTHNGASLVSLKKA